MGGAVTLAATAAFRADAGYVTVCSEVEPQLLEAVKRPLDDALDAAAKARALAIGPGLGRSPEKQALVRRLLEETDLPAVVDADALFGLEPFVREAPTVLTPHAGELARLLDRESAWVDAHRLEAVRARRSGSAACACSRGRTRSSPRRRRGSSSAGSGIRRSRRPGRATCSPA